MRRRGTGGRPLLSGLRICDFLVAVNNAEKNANTRSLLTRGTLARRRGSGGHKRRERGSPVAKIGFLGLGEMGRPMASRLLRAGHVLTVWNRDAERTVPLAEEGAMVASSPAKVATGADFVITMLATPEALEQVLFGTAGLAPALTPGQVLIDMSTVGPDEIRSVAARLPRGVSLVDAPVRGSVPQATSGHLDIFVGATDEDYERVRPILECLGS